jgi:hypothetical protein
MERIETRFLLTTASGIVALISLIISTFTDVGFYLIGISLCAVILFYLLEQKKVIA